MNIGSYWNKTAEVNSEGHTLRDCMFDVDAFPESKTVFT